MRIVKLMPVFVAAIAVLSCADGGGPPLSPMNRVANEGDCEGATVRAQLERNGTVANQCDGGPDPGPQPAPTGSYPGIYLGAMTWEACTNPANLDTDIDGISDDCEQAVAAAFAPLMGQSPSELSGDPWIPGEYYHAVRRLNPSPQGMARLRLLYLPAYLMDHGDNLDNWEYILWLFGIPFFERDDGHLGDSESIAVDVEYGPYAGMWYVIGAHLSQHNGGKSYGHGQLQYENAIPRAAPRIWVANVKHANYASEGECDDGAFWTDHCGGLRTWVKFPVSPDYNLGSVAHKQVDSTKVRRDHSDQVVIDSTRWEKFWVSDGFYGWQPPPYTKQIYGRTVWMGTTGYFITMGQFGFLSMNNGSTLPPDSGCSDPTVIYCPPD